MVTCQIIRDLIVTYQTHISASKLEILLSSARRVPRDFACADAVADGSHVAFYLGPQPFVWAATKGDKHLIREEAFCGGLPCAFSERQSGYQATR